MKQATFLNTVFPPPIQDQALRQTGLFMLLSIASGLIIGALTLLGQGALPAGVAQFANSDAVWIIIAFALGRFAASWQGGVVAGFIAVLGEVAGYYLVAYYFFDIPQSLVLIVFWSLVASVAGPLLGWAGFVSRNGFGWTQKVGAASLAGAFVGEGLYLMTILPTTQTGFLWLLIALAITLIMIWKAQTRFQIFALTIVLGLLFFGGVQLLVLFDHLRAATFTG